MMHRALTVLVVLVATALSGCLAGGPAAAPGAARDAPDPATSPDRTDPPSTNRSDGPSAGPANRTNGTAATVSTLRVTGVGSRHVNLTYRVHSGGRHRVGYGVPGEGWTRTENRTGVGTQRVRLDGLAPNTTHRYAVTWDDGSRVANASGRVRTDPVPYGWADPSQAQVQPGARILIDGVSCTLAFILTNATNATVYALTAGHCLGVVGRGGPVRIVTNADFALYGEHTGLGEEWNTTALGRVEYHQADAPRDWGLVRVRPELRPRVTPRLAHWTGPTGVVSPGELAAADRLCHYSQTPGTLATPPVRRRCGRYVPEEQAPFNGNGTFSMATPLVADGDSGSPVVDYGTGRAVGILTSAIRPNVAWGPRLSAILDWAGEAGYDLRLAGAAYDPPPAQPIG